MAIHKTLQIFKRYGRQDVVIPIFRRIEDEKHDDKFHFIGYEDADGKECDENGVYLEQKYKCKD